MITVAPSIPIGVDSFRPNPTGDSPTEQPGGQCFMDYTDDSLVTRPATGHAGSSDNVAAKLIDVMISSLMTDRFHGGLLDSAGSPPATWDLRQSSAD